MEEKNKQLEAENAVLKEQLEELSDYLKAAQAQVAAQQIALQVADKTVARLRAKLNPAEVNLNK